MGMVGCLRLNLTLRLPIRPVEIDQGLMPLVAGLAHEIGGAA